MRCLLFCVCVHWSLIRIEWALREKVWQTKEVNSINEQITACQLPRANGHAERRSGRKRGARVLTPQSYSSPGERKSLSEV
jgi:hypothetical protein